MLNVYLMVSSPEKQAKPQGDGRTKTALIWNIEQKKNTSKHLDKLKSRKFNVREGERKCV